MMAGNAESRLTNRPNLWSLHGMMSIKLLLICSMALLWTASVTAQRAAQPATGPSQAPPAGAAISVEQAHAALDVLNDPKKRAAFAATLDAIVRAGPAATATPASTATTSWRGNAAAEAKAS